MWVRGTLRRSPQVSDAYGEIKREAGVSCGGGVVLAWRMFRVERRANMTAWRWEKTEWSTANKTTQLKIGQKTWIDISPKKIYRWPTSTWKNAQHLWLLEKCKSKLLWGTTSHQSEWPSLTSPQITNAGEGVEKRVPSDTVGGNVKWYNHYGKQYGGTSEN